MQVLSPKAKSLPALLLLGLAVITAGPFMLPKWLLLQKISLLCFHYTTETPLLWKQILIRILYILFTKVKRIKKNKFLMHSCWWCVLLAVVRENPNMSFIPKLHVSRTFN